MIIVMLFEGLKLQGNYLFHSLMDSDFEAYMRKMIGLGNCILI